MTGIGAGVASRIAAVQRTLRGASADLLVATDHATVRWLCGHGLGMQAVALVDSERASFVEPAPGVDYLDVLMNSVSFASLRRLSVVAIETPHAPGWVLRHLSGHPLVDVTRELEALRVVKDDAELTSIAAAAKRASDAQRIFRSEIAQGVSEHELSDTIQMRLAERGLATVAVVDLMFAERCALIGAAPTNRVLAIGQTALFDFAPIVDDYWGDSCSTIVLGEPSEEIVRVHAAVRRALDVGISFMRPGVMAADVDKAVRASMADAGYHYPHLTGHGVGLKQQEYPFMSADSGHVLQANTVIALEPGAYLGQYGLRLEHLILVTEGDPVPMTTHSLELRGT